VVGQALSPLRRSKSKNLRDAGTTILLVGVDNLERLRGISLKLLALDKFLETNPSLRGRVRLYQVGLLPDSRPDDYRACKEETERLVETLNNKWAGVGSASNGGAAMPLIVYEEKRPEDFGLDARIALFLAADALIVTAVRAGADQTPLEFVLVKRQQYEQEELQPKKLRAGMGGAVILSEFCGCAAVLNNALRINPWKQEAVSAALEQLFDQDEETKRRRIFKDSIGFVEKVTASMWAGRLLAEVQEARKKEDQFTYTGVGFGFGFRVLQLGNGFEWLDKSLVRQEYEDRQKRLLLIEVQGVIDDMKPGVNFDGAGGAAQTTKGSGNNVTGRKEDAGSHDRVQVDNALRGLCKDPHNIVFVLSNLNRSALSHAHMAYCLQYPCALPNHMHFGGLMHPPLLRPFSLDPILRHGSAPSKV
jgi:trehalose 6-phosphate synthase/phosphatase